MFIGITYVFRNKDAGIISTSSLKESPRSLGLWKDPFKISYSGCVPNAITVHELKQSLPREKVSDPLSLSTACKFLVKGVRPGNWTAAFQKARCHCPPHARASSGALAARCFHINLHPKFQIGDYDKSVYNLPEKLLETYSCCDATRLKKKIMAEKSHLTKRLSMNKPIQEKGCQAGKCSSQNRLPV